MDSMDVDSPATPSLAITPVPAEDNGITPVSTEQPNKRRKKSIVWDHFTIETVGPDCTRASCNHCKKSFAYITGSKLAGTSHLKRHIDLGICPVSHQKNEASQHISGVKSEPPPKRRYRTSPALRSVPFDQNRCNLDVAKMIIQHEYPLHIVEHPGFVDLVRSLQPQYSMASFDTIQGEIVALYLREKQGLLDLINGLPGRVSISLDLKTSNLDVGYGFLTGHFIDNDWKLHHRILNVVMLPFPESEYAFNQAVVSCISDWHLESRLFSLTLDQSVSNESIIGNLRGLLSVKNQFMFNGQLVKGNCYAQVLSRLAQDALAATDEVVKRIRESVKYVKTSDSHDEKFAELRQRLQVPSTRDLFIDDKTKWDTTYHMLVAACELKEVFSCLDTTDSVYKINPSMDDWKQVEILCTYLKLLYDAASILTGPLYPPANLFYHEVSKIQLELTHAAASEDPFVSNLARPLKERFDEYWRDCFLVLAIAIVMDPRFKMKLVEFSFSRIFGDDAGMWIKIVDNGIHELFLDYLAPNLSVPTTFMDVGNTSISHSGLFQEENHHVDVSSQPNGELVKDPSSLVMNHYEAAHEFSTQEVPLQDMYAEETLLQESQEVAKQMDKRSVEAKEVNGHLEASQEMESQEGRQEMNDQADPPEMDSQEAKMEEIHNTAEVPVQENHIEGLIKENNKEQVSPKEMLTKERIASEVIQAQGNMEKMEGQEKVTQEIQDQDKQTEEEENITVERHAQEQKPDMDAHEKSTQEVDSSVIATEDMRACENSTNDMCAQEAPGLGSQVQTPKEQAEELKSAEEQIKGLKPAEQQTELLKPAEELNEGMESAEEKTTEIQPSEFQTEEVRPVEAPIVELEPSERQNDEVQLSDGLTLETETEGQTQEMHSQSREMQLKETQAHSMQPQGENHDMQTQHLQFQDMHFQGLQFHDQDQQAMYNQEMHSQGDQDFPVLSVGDGLHDFELYISEFSNSQHLKSELDQYLEESLLPRVQDFDVLGWWRLNKLKYPTLSKMAADILSIPISTVAPESVFDIGSRKIDSYRSSLQPVTLEALVCAKDWLQFGSSDSSLDMPHALMKMEH